jgi:Carboxypeptidase regulatory-like domain
MISRIIKYLPLITLAALCIAISARAQTTAARLTGTVTDSTGAAIPNAKVSAKNLGTNFTQVVNADGAGQYSLPSLPPGSYLLSTEAEGFQRRVQSGIMLTVGQNATLNIVLQPGSTGETVTVTGGAGLINATSAEISQVINENSVKELPLNGRDPSSLVFLTTGVTNELQSHASTLPTSNSFPTESGASAGGGRQGSTWYLLDGVSNMDTYSLLAAPFPNADATQEFRVISNNFDARYGFAPGAIVNIQTKSGTNDFRGGAFEFLRNSALNASNYFTHAVDPLRRNQFGGYVGGPILKDKLFFFANYQGTRASLVSSSNPTYTPTAAMLKGDFSAVPIQLVGPFRTISGKENQVEPFTFQPWRFEDSRLTAARAGPSHGSHQLCQSRAEI